MDRQSNPSKKLLGSFPMTLVSKESSIKIGKINDPINTEKTVMTRDPASKNYKLIERKSNKEESRFTGSQMAEQSSKYLMAQYNSDTGKIEVCPGGDWYFFKKEINYPTMSIEEVEEKIKSKTSLLDYIRNKGVITKPKKEKKVVKKEEGAGVVGRIPFGRLNDEDEDMDDEVRNQLNPKVEEQSEEERPEDNDPELRDVPSDIEEGFIKGVATKEEDVTKPKEDANEESFSIDDDDNLFGADEDEDEVGKNDNDDEEVDDSQGFSEIDKEEDLNEEQANYISLNNRTDYNSMMTNVKPVDQEFIRTKRKCDERAVNNIMSPDRKKQRTSFPIEDVLDGLFAKNKRMTYDKIVKELIRSNFSKNEIDSSLPNLLRNMCDKFPQGGEYFYFRKSDK